MGWNLAGWLSKVFAGPAPDPNVALIPAARITTDFYPISNAPGARHERYYAEKQSNGLLTMRFQSAGGGGVVSNAMADATMNRLPPCNLTLEQALAQLRRYDEVRRQDVGADQALKAPESDLHFSAASIVARAAARQQPADPAP